MRLSSILREMSIRFNCIDEQEFLSLGLAGYNSGEAVCTFLEDIKYYDSVSSNVTMLITNLETAKILKEKRISQGICIVDKPRIVFFQLHNFLSEHPGYRIPRYKTRIGKNCSISPMAVIAEHNVTIGDNVIIEPFCVIYEDTQIGDCCIIRSGSKIGSEGFEFKKHDARMFRVNHVGGVLLKRGVEIQSNTCVDKAIYPWDNTLIDDYVKVDNLVHIAHGVKIGKRTMVVANASIGGRVTIGDDAWIGLGAQIRNGLSIGTAARVNMGAIVTKSVDDGESVSGNFAIKHELLLKSVRRDSLL